MTAAQNKNANAAEEISMTPLRKRDAAEVRARGDGARPPVDYSGEVTKEQVKRVDELVKEVFEDGEWVTVEGEP